MSEILQAKIVAYSSRPKIFVNDLSHAENKPDDAWSEKVWLKWNAM